MNFKKISTVLFAFGLSNPVFAFDEIQDEEMSIIDAQDGVSVLVGLPTAGWMAQQVVFLDGTGIDAATFKPGYDFYTGAMVLHKVGLKICSENAINGSCTSVSGSSVKLDFDVVGDTSVVAGNQSMLNMELSLISTAKKMRFYLDKVSIRNGAGNNSVDFIDFGGRTGGDVDAAGDYFDILPVGSSSLLNLQLGSESQGNMLKFVNGRFGSIDFGTVSILDKQYTVANNRSLRFGLRLDNVDVTGMGVDIGDAGLVLSIASFPVATGKMDITLSNISAGNITTTNMGTLGVKGLQVTNLAMTISGKN